MCTLGVTPRGFTGASLWMYTNVTSHGSPTVVPSGGGLSEMPVFATAAAGSRASRTNTAMAVIRALIGIPPSTLSSHLQAEARFGSGSAHRAGDLQRSPLRHVGLDPHEHRAVAPDQR